VTTGAADQLGLGALVMNISHVGLQALAGAEGLLAETAGNQNVGMFRLFVFVQLRLGGESGQTFITGNSLLLRMNNQGMFSELTVCSKCFLAIFTLEWSLVKMHHQMVLQFGRSCSFEIALVTLQFILISEMSEYDVIVKVGDVNVLVTILHLTSYDVPCQSSSVIL
jgi:hypothetical protein